MDYWVLFFSVLSFYLQHFFVNRSLTEKDYIMFPTVYKKKVKILIFFSDIVSLDILKILCSVSENMRIYFRCIS